MNFMNEVYANVPMMVQYFGDPAAAVIVNSAPMPPAAAYRSFMDWLKQKQPDVYAGLEMTRPDLVAPDLVFRDSNFLGDAEEVTVAVSDQASSGFDVQAVATRALDILKESLPTYLQYSTQKQLIDLNIERAKRGLAPVDSSTIAPTVNVGVSSDVQKLVTLGLLGAFGLGALSLMTRGKRR